MVAQTLDYENLYSNDVLPCQTLDKTFSLSSFKTTPVQSPYMMSTRLLSAYLCTNSL